MNNSSVNIIKRQLMIIQFLLESNYVSTEDIQKYLKANSFDVPIRNIQRDLAVLEEIIPLECKKDDKPYSWRWKRLPDVQNHDLTITQAVVLRMVETAQSTIPVIPPPRLPSIAPHDCLCHQFASGVRVLTIAPPPTNH